MTNTLAEKLTAAIGAANVRVGAAISDDYSHDESLTATWHKPDVVATPTSRDDVVAIVCLAQELRVPVTARGSGTGLSGASIARHGGILMSFEKMNVIVEVDTHNHTATVQPGVTLAQLNAELAKFSLVYPVFPGEDSASLGGNIATNAGGMRAVKYGVTRHQVLGLEMVLAGGDVIRSGGKFVKSTSGYDLTQLMIGSEGTLALVTEATLRLYPLLTHSATVLVPFASLDAVATAVPAVVATAVSPLILEYVDVFTMAAIVAASDVDLGVPAAIQEQTSAYLVIMLEDRTQQRIDDSVELLGGELAKLGALDVFVLPATAARQLIGARERAFWTAKAAGADDIIDVVIPRAEMPRYLAEVALAAQAAESMVIGCGHVGDGNVHLSVFQSDEAKRHQVLDAVFRIGVSFGGAVSGEHGIGSEKLGYFSATENPAKLRLMQQIKAVFDPHGILNPGALLPGAVVDAESAREVTHS